MKIITIIGGWENEESSFKRNFNVPARYVERFAYWKDITPYVECTELLNIEAKKIDPKFNINKNMLKYYCVNLYCLDRNCSDNEKYYWSK